VLPFLDLTDQMANEIFADGMTEELIDKLVQDDIAAEVAKALRATIEARPDHDSAHALPLQ